MKYLFLFGFLGLVIIGCLFYPPVNEDTDSSCAALEKQIIRVNTHNEVGSALTSLLLGGISQGQIARKMNIQIYRQYLVVQSSTIRSCLIQKLHSNLNHLGSRVIAVNISTTRKLPFRYVLE